MSRYFDLQRVAILPSTRGQIFVSEKRPVARHLCLCRSPSLRDPSVGSRLTFDDGMCKDPSPLLGERVARGGVFISRGEAGEEVSPIVNSKMGHRTGRQRMNPSPYRGSIIVSPIAAQTNSRAASHTARSRWRLCP